jgi:hypothetical protein
MSNNDDESVEPLSIATFDPVYAREVCLLRLDLFCFLFVCHITNHNELTAISQHPEIIGSLSFSWCKPGRISGNSF